MPRESRLRSRVRTGRRLCFRLYGAVLGTTFVFAAAIPSAALANSIPRVLEHWFHYNRPAHFGVLKSFVQVPMRDGVKLGCDLFRPAHHGRPAPGRFPGIISQFSPYFVGNATGSYVASADLYSSHGYVDLECNVRGTGRSGGVWMGSFGLTPQENNDNYDMIEWLAHRPYSTGKIGQEGESYGGITTYRVAEMAHSPPNLVTIVPQQSSWSVYLDCTYPGGIRSGCDPTFALVGGLALSGGRALPLQTTDWLAHPLLDAYWRQLDVRAHLNRIKIPILGFGGWIDPVFGDAMARNYEATKTHAWLVDGPWLHAPSKNSDVFGNLVTRGTTLAWFDHWLLHMRSAPLPPARVMSVEMGSGNWHLYPSWPPPGTHDVSLRLNTDGSLAARADAPGHREYVANTASGVINAPSGDHLDFTSAPLPKDLVVGGAGTVHLRAALTDPAGVLAPGGAFAGKAVDTDFVFRLFDVAPTGAVTQISQGFLKASHRRSQSFLSQIPLGQTINYTISLWNVDRRIPRGHRLRLLVTAGDQPLKYLTNPAAIEPEGGSETPGYQPIPPLTVMVATGMGGSTLELPIVGPKQKARR